MHDVRSYSAATLPALPGMWLLCAKLKCGQRSYIYVEGVFLISLCAKTFLEISTKIK